MAAVTTPAAQLVLHGCILILKPGRPPPSPGPVIYWMFHAQRVVDNWALLHPADVAARSSDLFAVAFTIYHRFLGSHAHLLGWMLCGLRRLHSDLSSLNIPTSPLFLLRRDTVNTVPGLLDQQMNLAAVVFSWRTCNNLKPSTF